MTTDQIRDELARRAGWEFRSAFGNHWWRRVADGGDHEDSDDHPFPPTLDGAASAMPEGWWWSRYETVADGGKWCAGPRGGLASVCVYDTGDPVHDLYALALACVRAKENSNGKA